jgi:hypothetical protein
MRAHLSFVAAVASAALLAVSGPRALAEEPSGPRVIQSWELGQPVPPGYHPATRRRVAPIVGGSVLLGATYVLSVFASLATDVVNSNADLGVPGGKNNHALLVPVVGPFWDATESWTDRQKAFLVIDGLAQSAGLALLIYGLVSPKPVLVRDQPGLVMIAPLVLGRDAGGVGLAGRF